VPCAVSLSFALNLYPACVASARRARFLFAHIRIPLALHSCLAHRYGCGHKTSHSTGFTQWVHTPALGYVPTASLLLQHIPCIVWIRIDIRDAARPFVEGCKRQVDCRLARPVHCSFHKGLHMTGLHYSISTPRLRKCVQAHQHSASYSTTVGTGHGHGTLAHCLKSSRSVTSLGKSTRTSRTILSWSICTK
jgi:hypothetical protein